MSLNVRRYESRKIQDKAELTEQGFLRISAALTRTGVFIYRRADGKVVRELRHPEDVFHPDSLKTLRMCPLTDDHPKDFIKPENFKELAIGYVSDTIEVTDNRLLDATVVVSDKSAIAKVDGGKVELSCGYLAELIDESGEYEGQKYDLRQKNIRYNHVALVERGRAGPEVRLRIDSDDATMVESGKEDKSFKEDSTMNKIMIDGAEYEVEQKVADAFNAFMKKNDEKMSKMKDMDKEKKDLADEIEKVKTDSKAAADELQAKLDHAESLLNKKEDSMKKEDILKLVKERKLIEDVATKVLDSAADLDASDLDLMKAVIIKDDATAKLDGQSEIYIKGRFDALASELVKRDARAKEFGNTISPLHKKEDEVSSDVAKKKSHEDALKAWEQPLAVTKK